MVGREILGGEGKAEGVYLGASHVTALGPPFDERQDE